MAFVSSPIPLRSTRRPQSFCKRTTIITPRYHQQIRCNTPSVTPAPAALILDCDGVIVESEEIHRLAYNDCWAANSLDFEWSAQFYEQLQNTVGGGKEKMAWYFDRENNWPVSPSERSEYLRRLHREKTALYIERVTKGVTPRRGVTRLIDSALNRGIAVAVASAANGDAVRAVLRGSLGDERVDQFATILAGDDVKNKKPAPDIYLETVKRLGVEKSNCVVIEDSLVGLNAAIAANIRVFITYTDYTRDQDFKGAELILPTMGEYGDDQQLLTIDLLFPHLTKTHAVPPPSSRS